VERDFRGAFFIGRLLGFLKRGRGGPELTDRGSYAYHLAEQAYTRQYIDKTWRISREKAWPQEILLW
jgi:oxygen-independent coproporphyrinogen-3 oxidase